MTDNERKLLLLVSDYIASMLKNINRMSFEYGNGLKTDEEYRRFKRIEELHHLIDALIKRIKENNDEQA